MVTIMIYCICITDTSGALLLAGSGAGMLPIHGQSATELIHLGTLLPDVARQPTTTGLGGTPTWSPGVGLQLGLPTQPMKDSPGITMSSVPGRPARSLNGLPAPGIITSSVPGRPARSLDELPVYLYMNGYIKDCNFKDFQYKRYFFKDYQYMQGYFKDFHNKDCVKKNSQYKHYFTKNYLYQQGYFKDFLNKDCFKKDYQYEHYFVKHYPYMYGYSKDILVCRPIACRRLPACWSPEVGWHGYLHTNKDKRSNR